MVANIALNQARVYVCIDTFWHPLRDLTGVVISDRAPRYISDFDQSCHGNIFDRHRTSEP